MRNQNKTLVKNEFQKCQYFITYYSLKLSMHVDLFLASYYKSFLLTISYCLVYGMVCVGYKSRSCSYIKTKLLYSVTLLKTFTDTPQIKSSITVFFKESRASASVLSVRQSNKIEMK